MRSRRLDAKERQRWRFWCLPKVADVTRLDRAGDTPTTDRIWGAFHSLTPVAVVESDLPSLLAALPFRKCVDLATSPTRSFRPWPDDPP